MDREEKETLKWEPWPYLLELADLFQEQRQLIILKARQLGISWLVVAFCLWIALFNKNVKVMFFSKGEKEAGDLIGGGERAVPGKSKFIHSQLPDFLRLKLGRDTQLAIDFPAVGSVMEAMPSTADAGRSTDATIVVCDEWEFHPYAEQNFAAVRPTLGKTGKFIALSTADKTKTGTFFKEKYNQARAGDSNFYRKFLAYDMRPGRDEEWRDSLYKDMPVHQVEAEYPRTEKEALDTLRSVPFFSPDAIEAMRADIWSELQQDLSDKYHGMVKIYRLPVIGRRYCVFSDPSDGKEDPHATVVMDGMTGEEVASSHGKVPADMCAQIYDDLVRLYGNAFNSYELNARAGGIFSQKIKDLETPNQAPFVKPEGTLDRKKTGWWTGKKLKDTMLWGLEEAVRLRQIIPHRKSCLDEFDAFMRPEGEEPQAPGGGHNDWIMAWGGVWQIRKYMPMGGIEITSFKYRES